MTTNRKWLVWLAVILGALLIAIGVVYFVEPAGSLPSFFPGHVSGNGADSTHHHTKHGIAAVLLGVACFVFAWFNSGSKKREPKKSTE